MNDEPKTDEEAWSVEPPKKVGSKKRKALRVALIVAVLATAVAAGVVLFGGAIRDKFDRMDGPIPYMGGVIENPTKMPGEMIDNPCEEFVKQQAEENRSIYGGQ